jgi:ATP-binding cassette subfamily A (ABC1) protein 3
MLVGLIPSSSGDAYMTNNLSIKNDLQEIRTFLGVCPQHDILFPELTVLQHLQMYASFKGVVKKNVDFEAKKMIAEVGLLEKINAKSSTLSGFIIIIIIF